MADPRTQTKPSAASGPSTPSIRCAIYTRKSTEEGLEQPFNSLDAQREACVAYIASQRHEGWTLSPELYDDGGYSGGNTDRPGLVQLMAEVKAGRVQVIVVYKVDRLTRSLADFAKIVEVLDAAAASFVSVTQSFNTTTSMGRLTLNVLLSFAQFEREVTGERIRDKIAASKRKGMWMGGPVPLGYDIRDRKLVINQVEADNVQHIFQRYLDLGSLVDLAEDLGRAGIVTKVRPMSSGRILGGTPFGRGGLIHLLRSPLYIGEVRHHGERFTGEHPAIIDRGTWDLVQTRLDRNSVERQVRGNTRHHSPLAQIVFDGLGRRMTPSHACKGARRFRYYITHRDAVLPGADPQWRLPAHDLEHIVMTALGGWLASADAVIAADGVSADGIAAVRSRAMAFVDRLNGTSTDTRHSALRQLVERIDVRENAVELTLRWAPIAGSDAEPAASTATISAPATRVRRGHDVRLVIGEQDPAANRDEHLITLMAEARAARDHVLAAEPATLDVIASSHGHSRKHYSRLVRLGWLAPDIVTAILDGRQPAKLTRQQMLSADALPHRWDEQRAMFGFATAR